MSRIHWLARGFLAFLVLGGTLQWAAAVSWDNDSGNGLWGTPINWTGNVLPNGGSLVFIGDIVSSFVTLDTPGTTVIQELTMSNGAGLTTGGGELIASEDITLSDIGTTLIVPVHAWGASNDCLDSNTLTVGYGATLELRDGVVEVDAGELTITPEGTVMGFGQLDLDQPLTSTATLLNNQGTLRGGRPTPGIYNQTYILFIDALSPNARVDLDGRFTSSGRVDLPDGTGIDIDVPITDEFNGTLNMGANTILDINSAWSLGGGSIVHVDASSSIPLVPDTALIAGGPVTLQGTSEIHIDSGTLRFNAPSTVIERAAIDLDTNTTLRWDAPTTIASPTSIVNNAAGTRFIVNSLVNIGSGSGNFDWDNTSGDGLTSVGADGYLNINVDRLNAGDHSFTGSIELNAGGDLHVNLGNSVWEMAGRLEMEAVSHSTSEVTGESIRMTGDVDAGGIGHLRFAPVVSFANSASVHVAADATLWLDGQALYEGGTFTGNGEIVQNGGALVEADTTIAVDRFTFDGGGHTYIIPGVTFELNVNSLDDAPGASHNGPIIMGNNQATLAVNTSVEWGMGTGGLLRMFGDAVAAPGSIVTGADFAVVSTGRVEGNGDFDTNVRNAGIVAPGLSAGYSHVGNMRVRQNYLQLVLGRLEMDLGGTTAITQHDQLNVWGNASLAGLLDLTTIDGYVDPAVPGTIDEFVLVIAGNILGTFDEITYDGTPLVPAFGVGADGDFEHHVGGGLFRLVDYSSTDVKLLNYQALPGDANGDGAVDGSDFSIWNANKFRMSTAWTTGDFNGDGITDGSDFSIWNTNKFVRVLPDNLANASGQFDVIPEPAQKLLLLAGLLAAIPFRRW